MKRYLDTQQTHLQHPEIMPSCFSVERQYGSVVACVQLAPHGPAVALQDDLGQVTDLAVHPAGFCIAICTGNGHMKMFDVRRSQVRYALFVSFIARSCAPVVPAQIENF